MLSPLALPLFPEVILLLYRTCVHAIATHMKSCVWGPQILKSMNSCTKSECLVKYGEYVLWIHALTPDTQAWCWSAEPCLVKWFHQFWSHTLSLWFSPMSVHHRLTVHIVCTCGIADILCNSTIVQVCTESIQLVALKILELLGSWLLPEVLTTMCEHILSIQWIFLPIKHIHLVLVHELNVLV